MKLVALSRKDLEAKSFEESSAVICVAYPTGRFHRPILGDYLRGVLHLRFSDCDGERRWTFPESKGPELKADPMTLGQGLDVIRFVDAIRAKDVRCLDALPLVLWGRLPLRRARGGDREGV